MPCEVNASSSSKVKHHVSDVPKSLSAHDCLIGVNDEQLLDDGLGSSSSRVQVGASGVSNDHLLILPPRNPTTSTSRHYQSSSNNVKSRGWYANRKAYRSVAYKTWSVGGARNMMNNSQTDLESIPNGSISDCEEKYYSAVDSDFEDCSVLGCRTTRDTSSQPRKCVSIEMFYDSSDRIRLPKDSPLNNNYVPNGSITVYNGYSSVPDRNGLKRHPIPSPGCSDHEETDCYSSADYCRFNQKRNGFVKNRIVRSFDAVADPELDGNGYRDSPLEPCSSAYDEEMQTVIDTFEDLHNLQKIKQEKINKNPPRSRSPFAKNTSQAFVKKIQQVLPNLHSNAAKSNNANGTCKSPVTVISANSEYYRAQVNNSNNNNNNINVYPELGLSYENYNFTNGEDAMEYLKNELVRKCYFFTK